MSKESQVKSKSKNRSNDRLRNAIRKDAVAGMTVPELASKYGITGGRVRIAVQGIKLVLAPRGARSRITPEQQILIHADAAAGMTIPELTSKYGIPDHIIRYACREIAMVRASRGRRAGIMTEQQVLIRADAAAGMTIPELISKYGLPDQNIRYVCRGIKLTKARRGPPKAELTEDAENQVRELRAMGASWKVIARKTGLALSLLARLSDVPRAILPPPLSGTLLRIRDLVKTGHDRTQIHRITVVTRERVRQVLEILRKRSELTEEEYNSAFVNSKRSIHPTDLTHQMILDIQEFYRESRSVAWISQRFFITRSTVAELCSSVVRQPSQPHTLGLRLDRLKKMQLEFKAKWKAPQPRLTHVPELTTETMEQIIAFYHSRKSLSWIASELDVAKVTVLMVLSRAGLLRYRLPRRKPKAIANRGAKGDIKGKGDIRSL